ncbi:MAG TPA: class I SAM-dependent methyltransferase [Tepidisphaeraceae bacterium]|jgi:SAM-dependent methyltransferase|nr:class I SAM-dependent methyltransferase [Tepidisphaeraceae bacterium]
MDAAYTLEYERFEKTHWWHVARGELIRWAIDRYADPGPTTRWLDIGCGTGVLMEQYTRIPLEHKSGLEMDGGSVQRGKTKGLDIRQTTDPSDFHYAAFGRFDLITLCDVIEHIEHDELAISGVHDALQPGGVVLVTVPALRSLWSVHDVRNHHFRRYVKGNLLRLFPSDRWDVLRVTYFSTFLLPMIWTFRTVKKLLKGTDPNQAGDDKKLGSPLVDKSLRTIFRAECRCIRLASMPLGSSLLLVARRLP